ncbi:glucose-6-phosphate dehydrogenase assembly protein OpcA [Kineococcus xinjiangensis]|uniref:Glucose-6-phosphate dehydrogenase assembly protein OpcA n=1 Tax=Kineococcus xinjiangensis TaxID=512762 RepID=A0A2S6IPV3_9ACTN|nr:glucose-6-phosphate dehydrogenase assembly protein OpcA [Kineococcus xinjiangensis]PPK96126.1 glucose-6-phosphate dehydrogenase assembly protein OpcA [Kineococcus xinjiangensis]
MIIDLPSTSTSAINKALVDLRDSGGVVALGRVLTLVVVTDDAHAEEAITAANEASREHPCRVLVLARGNKRGTARLDAQLRVGGDAGASEVVVLRLYGPLVEHGETTVMSLLLPDAPIVTWWVGAAPTDASADPLGRLAQRRITDSAESPNPAKALEQRRATYRDGDTDFAWTRLTNWRALLAAAIDQPPFEPVTAATVAGAPDSPSTELLAAWLAHRLKVPVTRVRTKRGGGVQSVRLERKSGPVELVRPDQTVATLTQPGQPDRRIALARRPVKDCLTEELRRLDPDEVYGEALVQGLPKVEAGRTATTGRSAQRSMARVAEEQAEAEKASARRSRAIKRATPTEPTQRGTDPSGAGDAGGEEGAGEAAQPAAGTAQSAEKPKRSPRGGPSARPPKTPAATGTAKRTATATKRTAAASGEEGSGSASARGTGAKRRRAQ